MLATIFSFLVASILILWTYFRIKMYRMMELAEKLPGPKPLPLIGNILELGKTPKEMFLNLARMSKEYSSIGRFWFGPILGIAITDPKHIEALLSSTKHIDKAWSYKFLEPWLGQGLLTGTGQKWKIHRKLITPTFHFKIMEQFVDVFNLNADIMIKQVSRHINGPEFDIYPYMTLCALDNICETAMGVKINAQQDSESEYVRAIKRVCNVVLGRSMRPWLYPNMIFRLSSLGKLQAECLTTLHGFTNEVIKERKLELQRKEAGTTENLNDMGIKKHIPFLDLLIQSSQDGTTLTDEELREEVDTIMFEGHDTTTSALCFTCFMLATHQHIQEKVMSELKEIFGESNRHATYQDLQQMKYLEQVIKETLRLYPSVLFFGRYLTEDLNVGDYMLPAGANVFVVTISLHRNPKFFPDPEKFDPERFLPENILQRHPYCYIPFAAGPRNCIGQKYAMLEIKATLCQLLRYYKLLPGATPLSLQPDIVLKTATGFNIKLELR